MALGNYERAFDLSCRGSRLVPADDTAAALVAIAAANLGKHAEFIKIAEEVADASSPAGAFR